MKAPLLQILEDHARSVLIDAGLHYSTVKAVSNFYVTIVNYYGTFRGMETYRLKTMRLRSEMLIDLRKGDGSKFRERTLYDYIDVLEQVGLALVSQGNYVTVTLPDGFVNKFKEIENVRE